ncbi:MAG: hypothetical protein AAGF01_08215 [Cyanobacteria bacterium P01_G01_bin.38]
MWRQLKNTLNSVRTYPDLSPDLQVRRQVNRRLRSQRPALKSEDWYSEFRLMTHCDQRLLDFLHSRLQRYSGLNFSRVRPSDHLVDDLQFPLVCWFDWAWKLCEDVERVFGVDISEDFDETQFDTVKDLLVFLDRRVSTCEAAMARC